MNKFRLNGSDIFIGYDVASRIDLFIKKQAITHIYIFVDANTEKYCLKSILNSSIYLKKNQVIKLPVGEYTKSLQVFEKICTKLLSKGIDRNSLIINIGGGVILDFGGFLSSVLQRGIKFINIPTTLLAQVDASIGGKVALNLSDYKNQIGLFCNPQMTLIDPSYLLTLSKNDFLSAQAEIFKYGLIEDRNLWNKLIKCNFFNQDHLLDIITECVKIKIKIVQSDYLDWNQRRKLNFGHTIAHAVESLFFELNQPITHGFAVFIGLICESYISYKKYKFSKHQFLNIIKEIQKVWLPIKLDAQYDNLILKYLKVDKKNADYKFNFTLITEIGSAIVNCPVSTNDILLSLDYYRKNVYTGTK
ncbi:MAG: 3-dehydroquinate synthase [Flavobacteriales bacterium]|mgnify:CR=1 FL=1|nr:3-dehydroquinate synthase [Flavobacteriales bacterium]|tara:strand:- start:12238 stop:13320 length:1083 start_codon:yes stop_codon:yes gene_type:complete